MTGETKDNTEPWIADQGAEFAYAYFDKADISAWMGKLGMKGYPSAVLVDPKGTVVWVGSPYKANGSLIEKHLKGASRTPVEYAVTKRWPAEAKKVTAAFKKGQFAKALAEAQLLGNDASVAEDVQRIITRSATKAKTLHESGDFLGFMGAAPATAKKLKGLPEGDELTALIKATKADKSAKSVMKAQKMLAKLNSAITEARKTKDLESIIKKLGKVEGKHEDDYAGETARKLSARAEKKIEALEKRR